MGRRANPRVLSNLEQNREVVLLFLVPVTFWNPGYQIERKTLSRVELLNKNAGHWNNYFEASLYAQTLVKLQRGEGVRARTGRDFGNQATECAPGRRSEHDG